MYGAIYVVDKSFAIKKPGNRVSSPSSVSSKVPLLQLHLSDL